MYYSILHVFQYGMDFHHAQPGYVMMSTWLSDKEPSMIPEYANQYLGNYIIILLRILLPSPLFTSSQKYRLVHFESFADNVA